MDRLFPRAAVALLFLGVAVPASAQVPDADAILGRFEEAIGASGNPYDGIESIRTNMSISMPMAGMSMNMQIDAVLPNKFVSRVEIPGMGEVRTGFDGTTGWSIDPIQGARLLQGPELDQAQDQALNFTDPGIRANLQSAEAVGEDTIDGSRCWLVQMTQKSGESMEGCFDVDSGLMLRGTQAQGGASVVSLYQDYKEFGPVLMASRIVVNAAGQEQVVTIDSVEYDVVDAAAVALPPEVQALVGN